MKPFLITTILLGSLVATACKKEKKTETTDDHSHASALITISSPNENDTIQGNFVVTGTIEATEELHGYQITVSNPLNDSIIYQNEVHEHTANFTINSSITNGFNSFTRLKLEIIAALDHDGNTETKSVHFVVH